MGQDLAGKVAVVTGGASGIGHGCVELFVEHGAKVVIADVDVARGEALAKKLGGAVRFLRTDVSQAADVQAAVDLAVSEFGGLHVMVNNAAIPGVLHRGLLDDPLDVENFNHVMGVNLRGHLMGSQFAARHMAKNGGGAIINMSSMGALRAGPGVTVYRASKVAIIFLSKCQAVEFGEYNIRVNCIAPGLIETGLAEVRDSFLLSELSPEDADRVREAIAPVWMCNQPLKRKGVTRDVAEAALYLASDRAAYVTGVVLPVEAGATAGDMGHLMARLREARDKVLAT